MAVVTVATLTMVAIVEEVATLEEIEEVMEEVIDQVTTEMGGIEMEVMGECHSCQHFSINFNFLKQTIIFGIQNGTWLNLSTFVDFDYKGLYLRIYIKGIKRCINKYMPMLYS